MSQPKTERRKSEKRSAIWLYFTEISSTSAKCNTCKNHLSIQGGSTSNLKKHMVAKRPYILLEPSRQKAADDNRTPVQGDDVSPQSTGATEQPTSTSENSAATSGKL